MDKQYKKYLCILVTTQILLCAIVASILIFLSKDLYSHNNDVLRMVAIKDTEECMREMVDNTIIRIDSNRKSAAKEIENIMDLTSESLATIDEGTMYISAQNMMNNINQMEYGKPIKLIIHNILKGKVTLFLNGQVVDITDQYKVEKSKFMKNSSLHRTVKVGDSTLYLFAEEADIDRIAKNYIYKEIHSSVYKENEYIWVNEILDYAGGDDYAIRVIHPNLKDTEGSYLSTKTQDIKGNLPYLKELNGIKQKGEIIHSYYFKNKVNDEITQKISYAKLYKPFNWIIATGKPLNDIFVYINELKDYNTRVVNNTMIVCLIFMIIIFLIGIVIIIRVHGKYRKNIDTYVKTETELDPLTGAFSRKAAETILAERFELSKHSISSSLLMMLDIDNFKKINDTFGHDVGDLVLKKVSQAILGNIREADRLFRWGGEEFVVLCNNVDKASQYQVGQKILECVNAIVFESSEECFSVSISIGSSYFHEEDDDYMQALKRADVALYHSKNTGKNKYTNSEEF
ncbi:MAG: sensor domain-containing diguanylate cyclase [Clostridium sp.]|nr:sensor domain-containing diguanylate cyclase [Clostridium sp.]